MLRRRTMIAGWIAAALACAVGCSGIPRPDPPAPSNPVTPAGDTTVVVNTPTQPCCKPSIWDFLGVPQMAKAGAFVIRRARSRLGTRFPGLEPQPELLPITDPANLDSPYPSVQAAAEVKAEEDAAPQKIKAISYLASLGCTTCYPDVEKAFLASLDDCNEEVRYATVVGLREANGSPCKTCKLASCCSPAILQKLEKIAFDTNAEGCFAEPSARVRRMARLAIRGCGNIVPAVPEPEVIEGPSPIEEGPTPAAPAPAVAPPPAETAESAAVSRSVLVSRAPPALPADGVLALVNGEPILLRDLAPRVEERTAALRGAGAASLAPETTAAVWRQTLAEAIDRRLLAQDARRANFGGDVALVAYEPSPGSRSQGQMAPDLEAERQVAERWRQVCAPVDETVSEQEVWNFYRANLARFQRPGMVRYESVSAPVASFVSRDEARQALEFLRGESLRDQAGSPPPGVRNVLVQTHDWTASDGLPSSQIAQALFAMPVGAVSPVFEDSAGFTLVRLLERRAPRTLPLEAAAGEIRAEIVAARRAEAARAYLEHLRRGAQIWNALAH